MENTKSSKHLKIWTILVSVALIIGVFIFLFAGENFDVLKVLLNENSDKDAIKESLSSLGIRGYIAIAFMSMLQVVFTFLPAEPVQVLSGIAFGFQSGIFLCFCGVVAGNTVIYILYRIFGQKLTEYFRNNTEFDFDKARSSGKVTLIIFILYFLPAIPYGLICFFASSLGLKFHKYITVTSLCSIPSIMIGVGLGHVAIASSFMVSLLVFAVLLTVLGIMWQQKTKVFKLVNDYVERAAKKARIPKRPNRFVLFVLMLGSRLIFDTRIKVKLKNNVGRLQRPAIVLCNHGSFVDFVYAGRLLRRERPNFITARLYFYHKRLGKLLTLLGCIPKSMFSADLENAKKCLRVLQNKGILAMMPEARLSTVGRFEGIQDSTYSFIARSNVAVYTIRLRGDYFSDPKWGNGVRRGGMIEGSLDLLFNPGEAAALAPEELKSRIDAALTYDEFEWIKDKPEIAFHSHRLAEGLENILCLCPRCGAYCSIGTLGQDLACTSCGLQTSLSGRYDLSEEAPFPNFAEWYQWQTDEFRRRIEADPDFRLEAYVELRHSSQNGKRMTRYAGDGHCVLDRSGLTYRGTRDGETIEKHFPMSQIYRLLFGAGEDFEIYEGKEIWYFVPEDKRCCVAFYIVSGLLSPLE